VRTIAVVDEDLREVPVVIITGKPSANSKAFYLDKGANGFFRKSIDGQALVDPR
jgi:CheY-like chemotaxis protein